MAPVHETTTASIARQPGSLAITAATRKPVAPDEGEALSAANIDRMQMALALMLLCGAGLLIRSFLHLRNTPLNVDPSGLLTFQIGLSRNQFGKPVGTYKGFTQADAVEWFRDYLKMNPDGQRLAERARVELRGKNLACWCKPGEPCHADVLLEIANR